MTRSQAIENAAIEVVMRNCYRNVSDVDCEPCRRAEIRRLLARYSTTLTGIFIDGDVGNRNIDHARLKRTLQKMRHEGAIEYTQLGWALKQQQRLDQ